MGLNVKKKDNKSTRISFQIVLSTEFCSLLPSCDGRQQPDNIQSAMKLLANISDSCWFNPTTFVYACVCLSSWSLISYFFFNRSKVCHKFLPCACLSAPSTLALPLCSCLPSVNKCALRELSVHASVTEWLAVTSESAFHFLCVCKEPCVWGFLASLSLFLALFICLPVLQQFNIPKK